MDASPMCLQRISEFGVSENTLCDIVKHILLFPKLKIRVRPKSQNSARRIFLEHLRLVGRSEFLAHELSV